MKKKYFKYIGLVILATFSVQLANSQATEKDEPSAAANATNPLAFVTKLQVQPNFTWKDNGGRVLNVTSRIIQPTASIGLPFIKSKDPSKVYTIYRLEVPMVSQTFTKSPALNGTGLSDLVILDAIVFKKKWGLLGAGPGLIIPTMNPPQVSSRKWAAGLAGIVLNTQTKGLQWGVLAQQFFDFGGDANRMNKNFMLFQPILNKLLPGGRFIAFSPTFNFNWTDNTYNIPLSVNVGKAFAKNLSILVGPEYVVAGPAQGDFTFRFQLNAMFPPAKNKHTQ